MNADPELERFVADQRAARRRRAVLAASVVGGLAVVTVATSTALRPSACERVANRICSGVSDAECTSFREAVTQLLPHERCTAALAGLDEADELPPQFRTVAMIKVVRDLAGIPAEQGPRLQQAARAIAGPLEQLDRTGSLTAEARQAMVSAPPEACLVILGKLANGEAFTQRPLHEVLVAMNGDVDLGPRADDWAVWCRARAGVGPPTPRGSGPP
jgi:hypothetical protein